VVLAVTVTGSTFNQSSWGRISSVHVLKLMVICIVHSDIKEVCGSSRIVTALVLKFARAQ